MMKKIFAVLLALCLVFACACASAQITVGKKDMAINRNLDKNVTNILVLMQDNGVTDTMMLASINNRTGRSVMTRVDCDIMVNVPEAGDVKLGEVYELGDKKSKGLLAARALNQLLDLNISTYVALDITRLPEIVEAVGVLNMQFDEEEAAALGTWEGINELEGEKVLNYVRLKLASDTPARSRGYDALMQLLYQGLHSGNVMDMMGLGKKQLASMDTNLNPMAAVTLVSAVQAGTDRRELLLSDSEQAGAQEMRDAIHREVYE